MPITSNHIVFLGDSLTAAFDLGHHFRGLPVINRGLSGDTTYEVLYRMGEIVKARPKKLFLMIGINDLFNGEDETIIFGNIVKILDQFRENSPETVLYLQSLLPVNESVLFSEEGINLFIFSLNDSLMRYCKDHQIHFMDLYPHFLDTHGQMDCKYTYDGVHLTEAGYELWAQVIRPYIDTGVLYDP